jgi:hypothetical protein
MLMKILDPNDRFFDRAWVRVLTAALPLCWAAVEFLWIGDPLWGTVFLTAGAYAGWALFIARKPDA